MVRRFFNRGQRAVPYLISVLLTLFLFVLSNARVNQFSPLEGAETQFYDTFMNFRNAWDYGKYQNMLARFQERLFIVTITDDTLREYGRFADWSREKTLELLHRLDRAGARVIFVDVLFTEASRDEETDEKLARFYLEKPGVILPAKVWRNREIQGEARVELPFYFRLAGEVPDDRLRKLYLNRSGMVGVDDIRGGRVREIPLAGGIGGNAYLYNVAFLCYAAYHNLPVEGVRLSAGLIETGGKKIPLRDGKFFINYLVKHLTLSPGETYADLFPICDSGSMENMLALNERDLKDLVSGRIVLVGASTPALGDIKDTPMGPMPGVYINAMVVANLLEGLYIRFAPPWADFLSLLLLGLVLTAITTYLRPLAAGLFGGLAGLLYMWGAFSLFRHYSVMISMAPPILSIILHGMILLTYYYLLEERQKNRIKGIFGSYLSPRVVEDLIRREAGGGSLGIDGKSESVTIFYSDIRGFTSMSEKMKPEEVVAMLNEYFDRMAEIVVRHGGYIDKYIGDCLMAVFTAPVPTPADPVKAVLAAVEQQEEIMRLKEEWKEAGRDRFYVGMGLNTGEVILGNIGSPRKKDYTVIGDNVNLAARLYDQARGGQILISAATYELVKDVVEARFLERITVKNKETPVDVYEVLGRKGQTNLLAGYDPSPRKGGH
jgi:adenylate cyclase